MLGSGLYHHWKDIDLVTLIEVFGEKGKTSPWICCAVGSNEYSFCS